MRTRVKLDSTSFYLLVEYSIIDIWIFYKKVLFNRESFYKIYEIVVSKITLYKK